MKNILTEEYLEYLKLKNYSDNTIQTYQKSLKVFSRFLNSRNLVISEVIEEDILTFKNSQLNKELSKGTVSTRLIAVHSFYTWLFQSNRIFSNPVKDLIPNIKNDYLPQVLSEEEIAMLFDSLPTNYKTPNRTKAMLEVLYGCLIRREELINLKLTDLNLEHKTVRIWRKSGRKNESKKEVILPLTNPAVTAIEDYLNNERTRLLKGNVSNDLWITSRTAQKVSYNTVDDIMKQIYKVTGVKLTAHCLRRSGACHLLQRGAPIELIQELLSHTTLKAVKHYLRLSSEDLLKMTDKVRGDDK